MRCSVLCVAEASRNSHRSFKKTAPAYFFVLRHRCLDDADRFCAAGATLQFRSKNFLIAEWFKGIARGRTSISSVDCNRLTPPRLQNGCAVQLRNTVEGVRICKLNQNIMTLVRTCSAEPRATARFPPYRCVLQIIAGVRGRAIFQISLGHRRFPVKGSSFKLIEDENGRVMPIAVRLEFDPVRAWRMRTSV
jgi:hypothetical protein